MMKQIPPTKLIRDLTTLDVRTISAAMMDNCDCRLVRRETAVLLVYDRPATDSVTIPLHGDRSINHAWALALALFTATTPPLLGHAA